MPIEFSKLALEHAPWSMSKASLADNCPFGFDLKYVKRVRGKMPPKSSAGAIGRAVHQVLENHLRGLPVDEMKNQIFRASVDEKLTTPEIEDVMGYARNILSFLKRLETYKERHSIEKMFVETKFSFSRDYTPTKYNGEGEFFKGVWDLVMRVGNVAIIVDHKSGEVKEPDKVLEQYDNQRRFYAIAAISHFPGVEEVQTAFHYVQSEEIIWAKEIDTIRRIRKEFIPWYVDHLNRCAEKIPTRRPQKGWQCSFCNYTHLCPLAKR
jgi:hypothetical protein